jgi:hypothetical protein
MPVAAPLVSLSLLAFSFRFVFLELPVSFSQSAQLNTDFDLKVE